LVPPTGEPTRQTVNDFQTKPVFFDLGIGKSASLQFKIKAMADQWSDIVLSLDPSNGNKIEKAIEFQSAGNQQFKALVSPEEIKPQQATSLLLTVREKETSQPVSEASVSVKLNSADGQTTEWTQNTNANGEARVDIPGTSANSVLSIQIQKDGFENTFCFLSHGYSHRSRDGNFNGIDGRDRRYPLQFSDD